MRFRRALAVGVTVIAAAASVGVAGCGSSSSDGDSSGGGAAAEATVAPRTGPLVINMSPAPNTLDISLLRGGWGPLANVYAPLFTFATEPTEMAEGLEAERANQQKVEPYLAESYETSEDGKTLTIKLRPDLKFSTGNPLNAEAVIAAKERGEALAGSSNFYFNIGNQPDLKVEWEAVDDLTLAVHLSRPEPLAVKYLAQPYSGIIDVKAIEENGGDDGPEKPNEWITTHSAGAGPYMFKEVRPGAGVTLTANPNFFGDPPVNSEVIVNFIAEPSTLLLQARNGEADVTIGLSKESVASLENDACCRIVRLPEITSEFMALPHNEPPFDNVKLREAIIYAIPYQQIADAVGHGYVTRFFGPFTPSMPGYNEELSKPIETDVEKAKQLIAESGVKTPVKTKLMLQQGNADHETIATYVKDALAEIGVELEINIVSPAVYASDKGVYQYGKNPIPLLRSDGPAVVDPIYHMDYDQKCDAYSNTSGYCDERTEEILKELHQTPDGPEKQALLDEATKIWLEKWPKVQFYAADYTAVLGPKMKKWVYFQSQGPRGLEFWD